MIGTYSTNFGNAAQVAAMLRDQGLEVEFSKILLWLRDWRCGPQNPAVCPVERKPAAWQIHPTSAAQCP